MTGGTGGVGPRLARHLVAAHGIRHLVLVSRRGADAPGAEALRDALRELGAETVTLAAADVTDAAAMRRLVAALDRPLGAVIHAAGVLHDQRLAEVTEAALAETLGPKLGGARILDAIAREAPHLTHFVLCSSAAGLLGNGGQAAYAAGNAALDGLALARAAEGLPATSVAWGPWEGAGMAADLSEAALARLARAGMGPLAEADALALFDAALASDAPVVLATRIERSRLAQLPAEALPPLLRHLGARARPASEGAGALARRLAGLDEAQRRAAVTDLVFGQIARVLGLGSPGLVNPTLPLQEAGLDSLMAVELRDGLAKATGASLPATVVFDHPTPAALVRLLLGRIQPAPAREAGPARRRARADEPIAIVSAACRLPGGVEDLEGLWGLLSGGVDAVTDVPASRWPVDPVFDPDPEALGKTYSRWGGFVGDVTAFEPMASDQPREARSTATPSSGSSWRPPTRRSSARADPARRSPTLPPGLAVGLPGTEYQAAATQRSRQRSTPTPPGTAHSAGRAARTRSAQGLNFPGSTPRAPPLWSPSTTSPGLREGKCDLAFAGGVNLMITPAAHGQISAGSGPEPDRRRRTFGRRRRSYVRAARAAAWCSWEAPLRRPPRRRRDPRPSAARRSTRTAAPTGSRRPTAPPSRR
ncbi:MAG: SDR family NAD(P)-dependent oxidoreductase [Nannocystaceae bacterium]